MLRRAYWEEVSGGEELERDEVGMNYLLERREAMADIWGERERGREEREKERDMNQKRKRLRERERYR